MTADKATGVELDFVVYLGDPDEGAEAIPSTRAVEEFDQLKDRFPVDDGLYGAITVTRDGHEIGERKPDSIIKLMTSLVRTLPYVIEGEPETALLTESEHGYVIEPNGETVMLSFFAGSDAFEPEELIFAGEQMPLEEFGGQLVDMCDRLLALLDKYDAARSRSDDLRGDLTELLDVGREAFKSYKLEKEHGLRH